MLDEKMIDFCHMYNLKNLINEPTCFKNDDNPSSIDVMLTSHNSTFHKMTLTVLKSHVKKKSQLL